MLLALARYSGGAAPALNRLPCPAFAINCTAKLSEPEAPRKRRRAIRVEYEAEHYSLSYRTQTRARAPAQTCMFMATGCRTEVVGYGLPAVGFGRTAQKGTWYASAGARHPQIQP